MKKKPLVSVLVTTFNRKHLLKRCLLKILSQTYTNLEVIVIDDASSDGTKKIVEKINDKRINYFQNKNNLGSIYGDRIHLKKFVYELCKGKYFVYVCDDDYWIADNLIDFQVNIMEKHKELAMVVGGQLTCFLDKDEVSPNLKIKNKLGTLEYVKEIERITSKNSNFQSLSKNLYPGYMSPHHFLSVFSSNPFEYNILTGATLYNTTIFKKSNALHNEDGSQWQAGYELKLGPGAFGGCYNIVEPCLFAEVKASNASFQRTQLDHYFDCIKSIQTSLNHPISFFKNHEKIMYNYILKIKSILIKNIGRSFLRNTIQIKIYNKLALCSDENIGTPVKFSHVFINNFKNLYFDYVIFVLGFLLILPKNILKKLIEMNKLKLITNSILFGPSLFDKFNLKVKQIKHKKKILVILILFLIFILNKNA